MKPMARNLTMAGVVLLFGAGGGIMLGNFVAGSNRVSGADELAAYFSESASPTMAADDEPVSSLANRDGPTSYSCDGCDAGLHKEPEFAEPADYGPLPPYEVIDLIPPAQRDVPPSPPASRLPPNLGEPAVTAPRGPDRTLVPPAPILTELEAP